MSNGKVPMRPAKISGVQRKAVANKLRAMEQAYHTWWKTGINPSPMDRKEAGRRAVLMQKAATMIDGAD